MTISRENVRGELLEILRQIRDDWECSAEITGDTGLFRDLGFESIDAIALGSALEDYFNRSLPFAEFLTKAREEQWSDITIAQLTDFLIDALQRRARGQAG